MKRPKFKVGDEVFVHDGRRYARVWVKHILKNYYNTGLNYVVVECAPLLMDPIVNEGYILTKEEMLAVRLMR